MDPTDEQSAPAQPDGALPVRRTLPVRRVTVNDVVSLNLAYFRKAAGLSQQELADRMGRLKSVVSTAERSWEAKRARNFTVDDLAAIAIALGIPIAAFLLPPQDDGVAFQYMVEIGEGRQRPLRDLLPFAFGWRDDDTPAIRAYRQRLSALGWQPPDDAALAAEQAAATDSVLWTLTEAQRKIDDLRAFERDYRNRLLQFIESQYSDLWAGIQGANPDALLKAIRAQAGEMGTVTVVALREDGTYDMVTALRERDRREDDDGQGGEEDTAAGQRVERDEEEGGDPMSAGQGEREALSDVDAGFAVQAMFRGGPGRYTVRRVGSTLSVVKVAELSEPEQAEEDTREGQRLPAVLLS